MYRLTKATPLYPVVSSVIRLTDGACIPFDPDNTDYQAYLKWVDEGNTPEAAE
jgi:hypothetical protein